jgi:hypothetical protein
MEIIIDAIESFMRAVAFTGVSVGILLLGYVLHDVLLPGKFGFKTKLLCDRNPNMAIIASSHVIASGLILFSAIWNSHSDFTDGLLSTLVFGLLGVVVLNVTEVVADRFTPGSLTDMLVGNTGKSLDRSFHPIAGFMASTNLVLGLIIAVSIA